MVNLQASEHLTVAKGKLVSTNQPFDYQWLHFNLNDESAREFILNDPSIPEFARQALVEKASRPRVEIDGDNVLIILRGANLNKNAEEDDMISVRILAEKNRLITGQFRDLKTTTEFLDRARNGNPERSIATLLAKIISVLFQRIEETVLQLSDSVDGLQESIGDDITQSTRDQISNLRRKVVVFKRHLLPQREVASRLRYSSVNWLHEKHSSQHAENYERIMRNIDELEEMRDKLTIVKEEVQAILSERLNRNTYVLSVVAAIFLPLGFLTGLMGINVGGMPGASNEQAFWLFCALLVIIVVIQTIVMRKNRWF